jgi:hypothetical protein
MSLKNGPLMVLILSIVFIFVFILRKPFIDLITWLYRDQRRLWEERDIKLRTYIDKVQRAHSLGLIGTKERDSMMLIYDRNLRLPVNMVPYYESILDGLIKEHEKRNA